MRTTQGMGYAVCRVQQMRTTKYATLNNAKRESSIKLEHQQALLAVQHNYLRQCSLTEVGPQI